MYTIDIDKERCAVHIKLFGFWDTKVMDLYERDLEGSYRTIEARHGEGKVLVDLREFPVQSAEIANRFSTLVFRLSHVLPKNAAFLTSAALIKLQLNRVHEKTDHDGVWFSEESEALAWLGA